MSDSESLAEDDENNDELSSLNDHFIPQPPSVPPHQQPPPPSPGQLRIYIPDNTPSTPSSEPLFLPSLPGSPMLQDHNILPSKPLPLIESLKDVSMASAHAQAGISQPGRPLKKVLPVLAHNAGQTSAQKGSSVHRQRKPSQSKLIMKPAVKVG